MYSKKAMADLTIWISLKGNSMNINHSPQQNIDVSSAIVLTKEAKLALYKKSLKSNISLNILEEVYRRGYSSWQEGFTNTREQFAFNRVNSFIAGGLAYSLDKELIESELISKDKSKANSRLVGTDQSVNIFKQDTPGQSVINVIRRVLKDRKNKDVK